MSTRTLFLSWHDSQDDDGRTSSRQWFPVGRLDADVESSAYRFRYTGGAIRAEQEAGFSSLLDFPHLETDYQSSELFPLFQNRIMPPGRPDFAEYVRALDLDENAGPIEILSANGGHRATDVFEVFPMLVKGGDGVFVCRFFLHGWRHVSETARDRLSHLEPNEKLYLALELTNPMTEMAVQVQTTDYQMIGWAPRYLVDDLTQAMAESPGKYSASVVRVNPQPAPSMQRVLVEMRSYWGSHEPMTGTDFQPLVE